MAEELIISPDGQYASGQAVATLSGHPSKVHTIAITCDGKQLISAGEDGKVYNRDFNPSKIHDYRQTFSAHQGPIHALALTSDTQHPALSGPLARR